MWGAGKPYGAPSVVQGDYLLCLDTENMPETADDEKVCFCHAWLMLYESVQDGHVYGASDEIWAEVEDGMVWYGMVW